MLIHYPEGTGGRFKRPSHPLETRPVATSPHTEPTTPKPMPPQEHSRAAKRSKTDSRPSSTEHKPRAVDKEKEPVYPAWFLERYSPTQIERAERLGELMGETAAAQNRRIKKECGVKFDLLNKYGAIDARIFATNNGGPIPDTLAQKDKKYVEAAERALADIDLPPADRTPEIEAREKKALLANRRARMERYKIDAKEDERDPENVDRKLLEGFRLERAMTESFQLEKAFVITFAKLIGPEYVVCRSTDYDDYKGVDTLIMNTKTGQVVCALDEVFNKYPNNEHRNMSENERVRQKITATENTNRKGGKRIEYGARMYEKDGTKKLVREPIDNVPFFYVAINKNELDAVIDSYGKKNDPTTVNSAELAFFKTVLRSWREQTTAIPNPGTRQRTPGHPIEKNQLEKTFRDMETLVKRFEQGT